MGNVTVTFNAVASDRPAPTPNRHPWRKQRPAPERCDFCRSKLMTLFVAGITRLGLHKTMCVSCHKEYGTGIGSGHGKLYSIDLDGVATAKVWG